jgi:hypothetical protein
MSKSTQLPSVHNAKNTPAWRATDLQSIFGAQTFLEGEDPSQYETLADHFLNAVQPRDFLEAMWVDEITKCTFESLRYRRAKTNFMRSSAYRGVEALLVPLLKGGIGASDLAKEWAERIPSSLTSVKNLLKTAGRTDDDITAETLAISLEPIERIEVLQGSVEERRNKALREVARHRETLARRLRQISEEAIQHAEFTELNNAHEDAA